MTSTAGAEAAVRDVADPRRFFVTAALLFLGSAALTMSWCASMSAMPGMDMPGGWTMSMAWMRMPGQSWAGAAATFIGMWSVMMFAMMLPAVAPALWRHRRAAHGAVLPIALGYFGVWILTGAGAFPIGIALAEAEMRLPMLSGAVPLASGVLVVIAGALQLSPWKSRQLACCRGPVVRGCDLRAAPRSAWRDGIRLGLRCFGCCAPMTAVLFVAGVMDLRAMALVTAAITAERIAPHGQRVAQVTGWAMIFAGSIYLAGAAGL